MSPVGSPPRMRGKPRGHEGARHRGRITPAHAGKTSRTRKSRFSAADHPRACGENLLFFCHTTSRLGSPPRMRGKRSATINHGALLRITPAHAGKTGSRSGDNCRGADHPRACGENAEGIGCFPRHSGSPPRMRGKHFGNGVFPWLILVLSLNPL